MCLKHSDGAVAPLLDDFIEMGVDVYNPVQPNVAGSDPQELKDKYGDRICFFGGIDQQSLLPSGNWHIQVLFISFLNLLLYPYS